ncbi:SDR family oxidoreductase [Streptomyces sp. NPDC047000]|uniref:SDR family oxidoreductase n=1 Tax=Streptomyces sp. NPDC047000 TaxID=3155474 RepID=UPI0033C77556
MNAQSTKNPAHPADGPAGLFSLAGRTALVTGAGSGIGQAIAIGLARAGADLVLAGLSPDMEDTAAPARAAGAEVESIGIDLGDPERVHALTADLNSRHEIDILVNNAGMISRAPAAEVEYADWRRVTAVNMDAVFLLSQAFGRKMAERGSGKIISTASLLAFQGGINVASYTATKHAVAGVTKALANEWGGRGVQVNAIAPGYIATQNTAPLRADAEREKEIKQRIPAGRWGTPGDIVGPAVFLASSASDYVNGHVLVVDGGWMAR